MRGSGNDPLLLLLLLVAAIDPVLSIRSTGVDQLSLSKDPDPPWQKQKPLCYATKALTERHVCGPDFKKYSRTAKSYKSELEKVADADLRDFHVGDRVQAHHKGEWHEGVVEMSPQDDVDRKGRWTIQSDADPAGVFLYTTQLRPTAAKVRTLGFLQAPRDDKYVFELVEEARAKTTEVIGAIFKQGAHMFVSHFLPLGGVLAAFVDTTMDVLLAPGRNEKLDLTPLFQRFEARLKLLSFGHVLDEIKATYGEFLQWMQELLDPELAPTELRYRERSVFMIESHLDVARVQFTQQHSADPGLEAYYLFEPLLQQATLHQLVMLMHVGVFGQLGEHQEALVHLGRAKRRYDQYRQRLSEMQEKLIEWRQSQVLSLNGSDWTNSREMCTETWEHGDGFRENWHEVEIQYGWKDAFEKKRGTPTLLRSRSFTIRRVHGTMAYGLNSEDYCEWSGVWSDGRDMLEEPAAYAAGLRTQLLRYTNNLLAVLDAAWLKLPGEECLEGFALHASEDVADFKCAVAKDESLPQRLREYFGPLHQDGIWPGQQPVLVAEQYMLCEKGGARQTPIGNGNLCVKFL